MQDTQDPLAKDKEAQDEDGIPLSIKKKQEEWKKNELFNKSHALHKEWQLLPFQIDGKLLNGYQEPLMEEVEGQTLPVIYHFKNGYIHSPLCNTPEEKPAVESAGHWEYWENGLIKKVDADYGRIKEEWKDGVPYKIEKLNPSKIIY